MPALPYNGGEYATNRPDSHQDGPLLAAMEANRRPLPHQLATIGKEQIDGVRLLYPCLRQVPAGDLQQAIFSHRRQLALHRIRAHGEVGLHRPRGRPDTAEVLQYRNSHPELYWMSIGGITSAILFEQERAWWLREGVLAETMQPQHTPADARTAPAALPCITHGLISPAEPNLEPTESEVQELRAQCAATAALSSRHVRSVVIYLRQRRWRREVLHAALSSALVARSDELAIAATSVRRRINELQRAEGSIAVRRANLQRVQELQRLLAIERARRSRAGEGQGDQYLVDRAVQTMAEYRQIGGSGPVDGPAPAEGAGTLDAESDADGGMVLDDQSYYSRETMDSDEYHDLFEELHGGLF